MKIAAFAVMFASLLAACGGGSGSLSPSQSQRQDSLLATPSSLSVNLLSGSPETFPITVTGSPGFNLALQLSATDFSFLSLSLQPDSPTSETLNVLVVGAGTSTITARSSDGASVSIPVTSIPCGRPDIINYAQLIFPANGAHNVPVTTAAYYVQLGGLRSVTQSPFTPPLHAHFVVNNNSTIDPQAMLVAATLPPDIPTPSPPPLANDNLGIEAGQMPQLAAGTAYTVYVYADTCETPWNIGSFST